MNVNPVSQATHGISDFLFMPLEAPQIQIPTCVSRSWEFGEFHLKLDVFDIIRESWPEQSADVFENESPRLDLRNSTNRLGEHVARVFHARCLTSHRERLTWRSAGYKIDSPVYCEIHIAHIDSADFAAL
jgi:hypothetical protein